MKVLRPVSVTDDMLVSSSVAEDDHPAWSDAASYAAGDRVVREHVIWESLQSANVDHDPLTDASDPPWWLKISSTNRWRMFDGSVGSATEAAGSIVVEVRPGAITAVGLVETSGASVRVQMFDGGDAVFDRTMSADTTPIADWSDYFFLPLDESAAPLLFEGLPVYLTGRVVVTITGTAVACGELLFGWLHDIGQTLANATAGITDYSRKATDVFGVTDVVKRAYSKRASMQFYLDTAAVRRTQSLLASLRATLCLWIGDDDTMKYGPLVVFGFFRDFQIEIAGPALSFCSLELEGVI